MSTQVSWSQLIFMVGCQCKARLVYYILSRWVQEKDELPPPKAIKESGCLLRTFFELVFVGFSKNHRCLSWDFQSPWSLKSTIATQICSSIQRIWTPLESANHWKTRAKHFITLCLYRNRCYRCYWIFLFFRLTLAQAPICCIGRKSDKSDFLLHSKFSKTPTAYTILREDPGVHSVAHTDVHPVEWVDESLGFVTRLRWFECPGSLFTSFMILDKLFNLSVPLFSSMVKRTAVTRLHWVIVRIKWVNSQVLVCLGCCNKTPWMCGLNRHLFLTVLEGGKSKIKVPADSVSWKTPLLELHTASYLLCPYVVKRWRGSALLLRTRIPPRGLRLHDLL